MSDTSNHTLLSDIHLLLVCVSVFEFDKNCDRFVAGIKGEKSVKLHSNHLRSASDKLPRSDFSVRSLTVYISMNLGLLNLLF